MGNEKNSLLTSRDVAIHYQVSVETLRKWRYRGEGPRWCRIGVGNYGPVRYRREDIDRFMRFAGPEGEDENE